MAVPMNEATATRRRLSPPAPSPSGTAAVFAAAALASLCTSRTLMVGVGGSQGGGGGSRMVRRTGAACRVPRPLTAATVGVCARPALSRFRSDYGLNAYNPPP
ncbi:hypothetical protein GCM10009864_42450 [Streptomyces lunalinharesii]|uniref:Uncharacterized protein n=1 Tax=Streptomyces lunalinharesii TaxID=333384 RepID=A0ABP6EMJ2_9ACTN